MRPLFFANGKTILPCVKPFLADQRRSAYANGMNDHIKGILITVLGVLCVVPDSLFVRVIDAAPMTTAFGRAFMSGATVFVVVLLFQGLAPFRRLFQAGPRALLFILLLGSTAPGFVLAITNTSVANVVFIFAATPVFAAIFSRVFLGELISRRMVATMVVVFIGLGIIAYGSGENELASWKGDLFALYVSCGFAGVLTVARSLKATPMVPAIPFAYFGAALFMAPFAQPAQVFQTDFQTFLIYGTFMGAGRVVGPGLLVRGCSTRGIGAKRNCIGDDQCANDDRATQNGPFSGVLTYPIPNQNWRQNAFQQDEQGYLGRRNISWPKG